MSDALGDQIAAAYNAVTADQPDEQSDVCSTCSGDGWYVGHEDECYDTGDCCCSGVQIQCECAAEDRSDG